MPRPSETMPDVRQMRHGRRETMPRPRETMPDVRQMRHGRRQTMPDSSETMPRPSKMRLMSILLKRPCHIGRRFVMP